MNLGIEYILSQVFTILMYGLLAITYYMKNRKTVLIISFLSLVANAIAYVLLNAWSGLAMCIIAMIRKVVLYVISGISAIFTYEGFFSLLSVFATMLYTYSVWQKKTEVYKLCGIPVGILWVLYNLYVKSIFGVILETVLLISSSIGYCLERKNK